jgi:hypothetical protein
MFKKKKLKPIYIIDAIDELVFLQIYLDILDTTFYGIQEGIFKNVSAGPVIMEDYIQKSRESIKGIIDKLRG